MRRPPPAAAEAAAPLTPAEFAALLEPLGPFEQAPRLAVAVSGGPDSMALAALATGWVLARGGSMLGLIVDHRLRPESTADAVAVAGWLERMGVRGRILTWAGAKPATGIQAAARVARMELLMGACRGEAILHLLLAHQREDQAETVVLRRAAGSGPAGLSGMALAREVPGLRLLRPLLTVPKARLLATLVAAGQPWLVDAANLARRFARGRLRTDPTFVPDRPWREALEHALARQADDRRTAALLARLARPDPLGLVRLDGMVLEGLGPGLRADVLGRVLATVGGRGYPVAEATVRRLATILVDLRATAGGCIIMRRRGDLLVCREPGRIRHRLTLAPGAGGVWDGRFAVRHERGPGPVEVRALGADGASLLPGACRARLRTAGVPAVALHGVPAAWAGTTLAACPPLHAFGLGQAVGFSITAMLQPALPLAAASFAGVNVVSNPQPPTYRHATAREHAVDTASVLAPDGTPGPTSRRTQ